MTLDPTIVRAQAEALRGASQAMEQVSESPLVGDLRPGLVMAARVLNQTADTFLRKIGDIE